MEDKHAAQATGTGSNDKMNRIKATTITTALAGALSMASMAAAKAEGLEGFVRCYGIAKAGQNSCASAAGQHTCAGQSTTDYSGLEWRATKADKCAKLGGKTAAFEGTGSPNG